MRKVFKGTNDYIVQLEHRITKDFEQVIIKAKDLKQARLNAGSDYAKDYIILDLFIA